VADPDHVAGFAATGRSFALARRYCEHAIARAARHGWDAEPFLSPRTVASHLYRAYPKLGIAGRHQLRDLINQTSGRLAPPPGG
jgi:hypothetical protein